MKQLRRLLNPKFSVRRSISSPIEKVWPILVDTQFWPEWGLSILSVAPSSQIIHSGMRGQVRTIFGLTLNFEITEYEENKSWDWDVVGLPITSHRVEASSPEKTIVIFDLPYVLFPYSIVCLIALRRIAQIAIRLR